MLQEHAFTNARGLPEATRVQCSHRCPYCNELELIGIELYAGKREALRACPKCKRRYVLLTEVAATTKSLRIEGEEVK